MTKIKHLCGCITTNYNEEITLINVCDKHKKYGRIWIGLQHTRKLEEQNEKNI